MPSTGPGYIGRFAPSPSGPLHLGSLLAALASYLDARHCGGRWLLRIEDIDPPRETPGSAQAIIHSLINHGLHWDGEIVWQHDSSARLEAALAELSQAQALFRCSCSRRQLAASGGLHHLPCQAPLNPGSCALRLRAEDCNITFQDRLQGDYRENILSTAGDTILKRRDGLYAYQLAVVVDDRDSGITDIVRGIDLLDSTPRQIFLQRKLGANTPRYLHIPVLTDVQGDKLSKQRGAPAINDSNAPANLRRCLRYLGQPSPPVELIKCEQILHWASHHWQVEALPRTTHIVV